ncbi:MAG: site-2 protease family protein [Deltaproteobacteria bacterium]|nr:site-2 protease family protein [Deltaproteobacteria bacterium]
MSSVPSILLAILGLGFLIIVHEAGHFLVARWSGMTVRRFSIGFGPALAKFDRWGTTFQIGAIPLGGFVQVDGLDPRDGTPPDDPGSYANKPFHLRFAMNLGGSAANYLFAFLALWAFFGFWRQVPTPPIEVTQVLEGSPAERSGMQAGDLITGTSTLAFSKIDEFGQALQGAGPDGRVTLVGTRSGAEQTWVVRPEPSPDGSRLMVGLVYRPKGFVEEPMGLVPGAEVALSQVIRISADSARALLGLLNAKTRKNIEFQGPPGIVEELSTAIRGSTASALQALAVISAALGWMNLLPIPGLDGSRLLFLLVGLVRRKEIDPRVEVVIHTVGLIFLFGLIISISIGDLLK